MACRLEPPDIVVYSLADTKQASALESLGRALEIQPSMRAIVLLERDDPGGLLAAVQAGASAVPLRGASAGMLLSALRDVFSGGAALDPRLACLLFERLVASQPGGQRGTDINSDVAER